MTCHWLIAQLGLKDVGLREQLHLLCRGRLEAKAMLPQSSSFVERHHLLPEKVKCFLRESLVYHGPAVLQQMRRRRSQACREVLLFGIGCHFANRVATCRL